MKKIFFNSVKFFSILIVILGTFLWLDLSQYQRILKIENDIQQNKKSIAKLNSAYQGLVNKRNNFSLVNNSYKQLEEQSANLDIQKIIFSENIFQLNNALRLDKLSWQYDALVNHPSLNIDSNRFYQIVSLPVKLRFHITEEQQWLLLINHLLTQGRYYQINNCEITAFREQNLTADRRLDHLAVFCLVNLVYPQVKNTLDKSNTQQVKNSSQHFTISSGSL